MNPSAPRGLRRKTVTPGSSNAPSKASGATRCTFAKGDGVWRLQGNCTTEATIELPRGVALDGRGMTITLSGNPEQFDSVGVRVDGAAVRNLTIDGQGLEPVCPRSIAALVVSGSADVENVTVANVRFGVGCLTGVGIEVDVFNGEAAALRQVTLTNVGTGILLTGTGRATIANCAVRSATTAVQVTNTVEVAIADITAGDVATEVYVTGRSSASVRGASRPGRLAAITVIDKGMATLGNLTLAGFGAEPAGFPAPTWPSSGPTPPPQVRIPIVTLPRSGSTR